MKVVMFSNCITVKGINRSTICDLQRQQVKLLPNSLVEMLENHQGKTVEAIKVAYGNQYDEVIDEYISFLEEHEFIFFTDHPEWFPPLNMEWDNPFPITNMIVDRNSKSEYDMLHLLTQIDEINCTHIEIRCFSSVRLEIIESWLQYVQALEAIILSIDLVLAKPEKFYSNEELLKECRILIKKFPRVSSMVIHSMDEYEIFEESELENGGRIIFTNQVINNNNHCGIVNQRYFVSNIKTFTEGQHHNTCLNRKLSIDTNGNIKNCPSTTTIFGNVKETTLQDVLGHPQLEQLWHITKDQIDVCKFCEFRYICTDCRAYIEDPNNIYSKPLKCGYNPETCEWEEWSTNPLKEMAIDHYGLSGIL